MKPNTNPSIERTENRTENLYSDFSEAKASEAEDEAYYAEMQGDEFLEVI